LADYCVIVTPVIVGHLEVCAISDNSIDVVKVEFDLEKLEASRHDKWDLLYFSKAVLLAKQDNKEATNNQQLLHFFDK